MIQLKHHLARGRIDHILGHHLTDERLARQRNFLHIAPQQPPQRPSRYLATGPHERLTRARIDHILLHLLLQEQFRDLFVKCLLSRIKAHRLVLIEFVEDILRGEPQRPQQDGHWQLAEAINPHVELILRIEFKIEPRTAIGNNAR